MNTRTTGRALCVLAPSCTHGSSSSGRGGASPHGDLAREGRQPPPAAATGRKARSGTSESATQGAPPALFAEEMFPPPCLRTYPGKDPRALSPGTAIAAGPGMPAVGSLQSEGSVGARTRWGRVGNKVLALASASVLSSI
jgi:hypothetical protein